ncbi:exosortase family protein XrtF [Flavobacterium rhizosphaerae]|uniref:Exosortase family protein XrtF n=1 Tax=Flavobacterium rhizosphaerae TaxID=3163298 RepID=A0ABW8YUI6_9FLAO
MDMFRANKPFFLFLLKFAGSYLLLSLLYRLYLMQFDAALFEPDGMTRLVAEQSRDIMIFFGENASIQRLYTEPSYRFFVNGRSVARVVEGCNAVNVMILFAAFVVAFSSTLKKTALYIVFGAVVIHILNVTRIALLNFGLFYYPEYGEILHDVVFPLFIYGVVFVLWVIWVIKFSGNVKKTKA